jgi:carbon-monoxide dehydrogenase large subunit
LARPFPPRLAQGLGQALGESMVYDDAGQLVMASFMDYAILRASHLSAFVVAFNEQPCRTYPLGVKGAGEGGCVAAPPALINAVLDALRTVGVQHIEMPATPQRIWQALHSERNRFARSSITRGH